MLGNVVLVQCVQVPQNSLCGLVGCWLSALVKVTGSPQGVESKPRLMIGRYRGFGGGWSTHWIHKHLL